VKTTVEISDPIFRAAREYCAGRGQSFRELVESGLRLAIEHPRPATCFRLKPFGFRGEGQRVQDWNTIRAAIYECRGRHITQAAPFVARSRPFDR
jgi:hypothetical protein